MVVTPSLFGICIGSALFNTLEITIFFLGGAIGQQYVDILTNEINYLVNGTYPSERALVFSSVILQSDRMVRKGADIR